MTNTHLTDIKSRARDAYMDWLTDVTNTNKRRVATAAIQQLADYMDVSMENAIDQLVAKGTK